MQELIARMAQSAGIEPAQAEQALGVILNFLNREAPEETATLLAALPGADSLLKPASGGGFGFAGFGAMGALNELTAIGLSMPQVQEAVGQVVGFARDTLGEDGVRRLAASIPGLGMFV